MSIMRASFVLTHRPGKRFVFTDYILSSMDEDFAKVGLWHSHMFRLTITLQSVLGRTETLLTGAWLM